MTKDMTIGTICKINNKQYIDILAIKDKYRYIAVGTSWK